MRKLIVFITFTLAILSVGLAQGVPKQPRKPTLTAKSTAQNQPLDVQIARLEQRLAMVQQQPNANPQSVAKLQTTIADKKAQLAVQKAAEARRANGK